MRLNGLVVCIHLGEVDFITQRIQRVADQRAVETHFVAAFGMIVLGIACNEKQQESHGKDDVEVFHDN
jgi:hypothetical protein